MRALQYYFEVTPRCHFAQIQSALAASHALTGAAEAHGTLAGALCALVPYRLEDWLDEILPTGAAGVGAAGLALADPGLRSLYEATVAALCGRQMEFDLLIPADDRPIEERTRELTCCCSGFLYGLGSSGTGDPQRLPGELGEIVRDLGEITRADVDASEGTEANERALSELVEFVRVGVQLVFDELQPLRERHGAAGQVLH